MDGRCEENETNKNEKKGMKQNIYNWIVFNWISLDEELALIFLNCRWTHSMLTVKPYMRRSEYG